MSDTRTETDSLGPIEVPASALYGAQTTRARANFPISGLRASPFLIRALAMIKQAAAEANQSLGLITTEQGSAIRQAAEEIIDGQHHDHFVVDVFQAGAGVSLHMNTNEVIANRAGQILGAPLGDYKKIHPNDHVNYGQSTNDVFPTAMRLSALLALEDLYPVLNDLAASLQTKAEEFRDILKSGRTHMQDATPITLGQEFAAYAAAIRKCNQHITRTAEDLRQLGLGGSAVGTGLNTHPDYRAKAIANLSRISGQSLTPAEDLRYAMQSNASHGRHLRRPSHPRARTHPHLERSPPALQRPRHRLRRTISPACSPARHHARQDQPGHAELAAMVGFQVIGNDAAVAYAVQAGQLELNVMMPTMAHNILQRSPS